MTVGADHDWFRARINPAWAGLLSGAEETRFEAHRVACASCRRAWQEFTDAEQAGAARDHVPSDLLSRWDRANLSLRGLERALVRWHLEHCEECRDDLRLLGFEPVLAVVLDLERERQAPVGRVSVARRAPAHDFTRWLLAGWATAATAALAWGVFVGPPPPVPATPPPTPATSATRAEDARRPATLELSPVPPRVTSPMRGGVPAPLVLWIAPEARLVSVIVPPLDVDDSARVAIEVLAPDGSLLASRSHRQIEFFPRKVLTLAAGDARLHPGIYRIRLRADPSPAALLRTPETAEYAIELRHAAP